MDAGQPEENTYRVDRDHDEVIPQEAEDENQHVAVVLEGVSNHPVHHYKITEVRLWLGHRVKAMERMELQQYHRVVTMRGIMAAL